jgi:sensor histidine kinase YesM
MPEGDKMRTVIAVEDNGAGFPPDVLEKFSDYESITEAKDHIGLSNVFRTLALTYDRPDLIKLSNTDRGARVIIIIPDREEKENETADM